MVGGEKVLMTDKLPDSLRPYTFHGVGKDCPMCGHGRGFNPTKDGVYHCFSCGVKGNAITFVRWLHDESEKRTKTVDYLSLMKDRRLLNPDTLMAWGVVRSVLTGDWLVPGYKIDGTLYQLYRYMIIDGRKKLWPTPTLGHQLHGVNLFSRDKPEVYICEGPWDAMTLWEVLGQTKRGEKGVTTTANRERSMLSRANVLAVPGCNVFKEEWLSPFAGKEVYLVYDSDYPRKDQGPAGYGGMKRVAKLLLGAREGPKRVKYISWGKGGFDPLLPSGYDVRDALSK